MSNYQDRFPNMLKGFLGEELYHAARDKGIEDNKLMSWYHELNRDQELFEERVEKALEETEELTESVNNTIENLQRQVRSLEQLKTGTLEDMVLDK